ncbi:MAG: RluA family pseudouridine synthase [Thermoflavifilum sp.]|nr:RluA family pseudouridine synthase [Thermoflavifilum sp.]
MSAHGPEIIWMSDEWLAINKPAGWLSVPDRFNSQLPNLLSWLRERYSAVWIVHRLDKDTSGVILFALSAQAHRDLCQQFAARQVYKEYWGIVEGRVNFQEKTVDLPIAPEGRATGKMRIDQSGFPTITHLQLVEQYTRHAWLKIIPATGRTHQIRVHLQHVGLPLVADPLYGNGKPLMASSLYRRFRQKPDERPLLARTALHAAILEIEYPQGQKHHFEAPLPKDMKAAIHQLRRSSLQVNT